MRTAHNSLDTQSLRWQAIENRTRRDLDAFVYGVVTTGVFCVPECRSRQPRRENIHLFDTWQEAVRAGFRPCKRCKPLEHNQTAQTLVAACERLAVEGATVAAVAAAAGTTEQALRKLFQETLGVSPREFQQSARLNAWKTESRDATGTLDALFAAGYGSVRGLYEAGTERLGMTPASYARGGRGLELRYESAPTALGILVVAGTPKGVSFVGLGQTVDEVLTEVAHDYPEARLLPAGDETNPERQVHWIDAVLRALEDPSQAAEIPLDVFATAFQARVWRALREIPAGETRTYSGLAAVLNQPSATRAVARACATNRVSILIPCHRVVGASGDLTGYRWGKERKAALLDRERMAALRVPNRKTP